MKHRAILTNWWWGKNLNIILENGLGVVELQFDDTMPNVAFVKGLIVDKRETRKGYARELMKLCHAYAKDNGKRWLQLSVNKDDRWIYEWYERLGFDVISVDEHEYNMMKAL